MAIEYCSQCGEKTTLFVEGYCPDCQIENQRQLDEFNASYDHWKNLSDEDRDKAIKQAYT